MGNKVTINIKYFLGKEKSKDKYKGNKEQKEANET